MIDKTSFKYLSDDTNRKIEYYERAASLCGNNNNNNSNKQLVLQLFDQGKCKYKKK
jgi:DNA polymerase I-like protein with 3'-5' exonuclease and polymerase domains